MQLRHADCDLRRIIPEFAGLAKSQTVNRIRESYDLVGDVLAFCPEVGRGRALDLGCGPGYESFALGAYFDQVIAIDSSEEAISEARAIAEAAGVRHVKFEVADVDRYHPASEVDFVHCNAMSHAAGPRVRLVRTFADAVRPRGSVAYGEIVEAYGAMEIHRAIEEQSEGALIFRIRQVLNALLGRPGFRLFAAGSAVPLLETTGFEVTTADRQQWHGAPIFERFVCRRVSTQNDAAEDPDYLVMPAGLRWVRERSREALSLRRRRGFAPADRDEIKRWSRDPGGERFSAYLLFLLMADLVPSALASDAVTTRIVNRFRRMTPSGGKDPDWASIAALDREFVERLESERARLRATEN